METSYTFLKKRNLFLICLAVIAIGLSVSKPLVALGQYGLFALWLFDGNIMKKVATFFKNKIALSLISIYILSLIGLLYSEDFSFAIDDLRRKLPIFSLPFLIIGFSPITKKEFALIFKFYVGGVLISTLWSTFIMLGGTNEVITDTRALSRFNSHIRFGLEICLVIFGSIYFSLKSFSNKLKTIWVSTSIWLISFLFISNLFTGVIILLSTSIILLSIYSIKSKKTWLKYSFILISITLSVTSVYTLNKSFNNYYQKTNPLKPLKLTEDGIEYTFDKTTIRKNDKENGYLIWSNIAWVELEMEWNKRSSLSFSGKDLKGQYLSTTLIRFLTSKGIYKNAKAVKDLTEKEVTAIEQGIPNYKFLTMNGIDKRIYEIIWEHDNYIQGRDFNGHSVIMRWEYWRTAFNIIKKNIFFGVGTGDLAEAFQTQYQLDNTTLKPQYQLRAHNQYITFTVAFGLLGIIVFGFSLIYPFIKNRMFNNYFYLSFLCIILFSMLSEDTLETQIGITFFAFFNTIFLLKEKN
ncbi:MAG: O-antigen ligase family protein [Vicingaceae bacterium]|nr:O-antigen ligase family protein [Vicingaceae bacterium]